LDSPLPAGLRPSAIGPGKRPLDVCFRVLWRPAPSPTGKASTTARCPAASGRPKTGTKASPRCSGTDVSRAPLCFMAALLSLGGFDPRQIHPRLPAPGRRVPRPPRQARVDFPASGPWRAPCLRAYALRQSDPANVHWTFAFGSSGPAPIPYRKGLTTARCLTASGRPKTGTKASPRCSGSDVSLALLIVACCPCCISWRRICFLVDLTRVKSTRACLPPAGASRASPGRRVRIAGSLGKWRAPCLRAYALRQSDPANVHWTFAFGSSGPALFPYRTCFESRPLPESFGKAEDGDEGQSEMFWDRRQPGRVDFRLLFLLCFMAAHLFPGGFDPRQVGALPRRPRLPAPGRRVPRPPRQTRADFQAWGCVETPLPAGAAASGNRTLRTPTGRLPAGSSGR
jgi:hypothetical protein